MAVEDVGWHFDFFDQSLFDLNVRASTDRDFHVSGNMVDVEGVSTDPSERLGIELFTKTFYCTGRSVTAVHPAIKCQYECARFEPDGVVDLEEIVSRSAHGSSIRVLQCFTKCGVTQNAVVHIMRL